MVRGDRLRVDGRLVKYVVDANVLSELTKPKPHAGVVAWLQRNEGQVVVNPIILGEIEYGILLLPSGARRTRLQAWFREGVQRVRSLDLDTETASAWASLLARLKRKGRAMPLKDSLIAATALAHELAVATRDVDDYRHAGVELLDPFDE
jgi:toxin FitB